MCRANRVCQTRLSAPCNVTAALDYVSLLVQSNQRTVYDAAYIFFPLSPPAACASSQNYKVGDEYTALAEQPVPAASARRSRCFSFICLDVKV